MDGKKLDSTYMDELKAVVIPGLQKICKSYNPDKFIKLNEDRNEIFKDETFKTWFMNFINDEKDRLTNLNGIASDDMYIVETARLFSMIYYCNMYEELINFLNSPDDNEEEDDEDVDYTRGLD